MTEDDPAATGRSVAWTRYRRMLLWIALAAIVAVGGALLYLASGGPLHLHMVIATIAGVGLSVVLGGGLMLLVFMSAGSGHDDAASTGARPHRDEEPRP